MSKLSQAMRSLTPTFPPHHTQSRLGANLSGVEGWGRAFTCYFLRVFTRKDGDFPFLRVFQWKSLSPWEQSEVIFWVATADEIFFSPQKRSFLKEQQKFIERFRKTLS